MKTNCARERRAKSYAAAAFTLLSLLMWQAAEARAQWATSGNNINNTNTGNVGVGTVAPAQIFHVHSAGTWAGTRVTTSGTGATINDGVNFGYDDAVGAYVWNREASPIVFAANNAEKMRLTSAGSLGVGTNAPASKLHIFDDDPTPDNELLVETTAGGYGPTLRLKSSIAGQGSDFLLTATAGSNAGGAGAFRIYDYTANATRLFIAPGGNVGVGTTVPGTKLAIADSSAWPTSNYGAFFVEATNNVGAGMNLSANSAGGRNFLLISTGAGSSPGAGSFGIFDVSAGSLASSYRFVINSAGNVGIGNNSPAYKLDVAGSVNAAGLCLAGVCKTDWSQVGGGTGSSQWTTTGSNIFYNTGSVGIGTTAPALPFDLRTPISRVARFTSTGAVHMGVQIDAVAGWNSNLVFMNGGVEKWYLGNRAGAGDRFSIIESTGTNELLSVTQNGRVGIGTVTPSTALHVVGDITATGNISAKYQDVAEWVPSTQKLAAGTVVVLDRARANHVLASTTSYDTGVAGVVSERPGLILGEGGGDKVMVATTGRVRVRVDATTAPIQIGDLLVTSDEPGVAMKSEPVSFGARRMHAPGTIIGKALEALPSGKGEILVLLSLQ
jgi:hypothetical protein